MATTRRGTGTSGPATPDDRPTSPAASRKPAATPATRKPAATATRRKPTATGATTKPAATAAAATRRQSPATATGRQPPVAATRRAKPRPAAPHLSVAERVARGKAARAEVPRSSQGVFELSPTRTDPVELLELQAKTRVPELVPIRYGRMLVSPFTFYRGAGQRFSGQGSTADRARHGERISRQDGRVRRLE
jgi:hypothetical protein